jgi:hypothetical protein
LRGAEERPIFCACEVRDEIGRDRRMKTLPVAGIAIQLPAAFRGSCFGRDAEFSSAWRIRHVAAHPQK